MAVVVLTREKVDSLADAIIEKAGSSESSITLDEMLTAVSAMESGQAVIDALVGKTASTPLDIVCASAQAIGAYQFADNGAIRSLVLPNVVTVGQYAFNPMTELVALSIPAATSLGRTVCGSCRKLASVTLCDNLTEIPMQAFQFCEALSEVELPSALTTISQNAFNGAGLKKITLPAGVVTIVANAFQNCSALAEARFLGTPGALNGGAFKGCTALLDIYVPWGEGEVTGAPWGATNATVHYNS